MGAYHKLEGGEGRFGGRDEPVLSGTYIVEQMTS